MNKQVALISLALISILIGYAVSNTQSLSSASNLQTNLQQPDTVPYVDINKYSGVWYEQAVIPFYFEKGCTKTTANYSLNADGKSIKIVNSCVKNGRPITSTGKAFPQDSTNSKLKVEFVQTLDIGAQYWIVRLGEKYEYTVVSGPNYLSLWILYRQPHMPEDLYQSIIADLKKNKFPVQKLKRTEQ